MLNVAKVDTWAATMDDRPGGLLAKLEGLAKAYLAAPRQWPLLQARNKVTNPLRLVPGSVVWIPVRLQPAPQGYLAEPIFYKSNLIFNLAQADGLVHIPADATGLSAQTLVNVILL